MKRFVAVLCVLAMMLGTSSQVIAKDSLVLPVDNTPGNRVFSQLDEILFSEDFSDDYSDWTIIDGGEGGEPYETWKHSDSLTTDSEYMVFEHVTDNFMFINSDIAGQGVTLRERLISPSFDLSSAEDVILLTFDACAGVQGDSCLVDISTTGVDGPWTTIYQFDSGLTAENIVLDITDYADNATVWISFYYSDSGIWLYGYAIDNITVSNIESITLSGSVTLNTADGDPLQNVEVTVDGEVVDTTDAAGHYSYNILAGTYNIGFFLENHIPVVHNDYEITGSTELDEALQFVDGSTSSAYLVIDVGTDSVGTGTIDIENTGYGPLDWKASLNIIEDPVQNIEEGADLDEIGDSLTTVVVSDGSYGCVITPDGIFTANATYGGPPGTLMQHDFEGNLVSSSNVSDETNLGFDLAYDPNNDRIIAIATGTDEVLRFPPVGFDDSNIEVIGTLPAAEELMAWGLAYDFNQDLLYFTDLFGGRFGVFNMSSGETTMLPDPPYWARCMTYMPFDPDGYVIWADSEWEEDTANTNQAIYRYNPTLNEWDSTPVIDIDDEAWYAAGGLEITNAWRNDFWDIALYNQETHAITIFEGYLGLTPWLSIDPTEGIVETGGATQTVTVNADIREEHLGRRVEVESGSVGGAELRFNGSIWHSDLIDVVINFLTSDVNGENGPLPSNYALHQNYPNPFNPTTEIKFDLPEAGKVKVQIFNALGQQVMTLVDREMSAGNYSMSFNGEALSSGVYFYRMEAGNFTSIRKMTLVK